MFEKIKRWYYLGLWTEEAVRFAAERLLLTREQAEHVLTMEEA